MIKKIIMLLKRPDPYKECLVVAICKKSCGNKNNYEKSIGRYWIALLPIFILIYFIVGIFSFLVAVLFYRFGVINEKQLQAFDPLPADGSDHDFY